MQTSTLNPVSAQERIQTIDIIRGFALVGILIINFTVDAGLTEPWAGFPGIFDQLVYWPVAFFLDDKFVAIYCFLFGLGFSIQMLRAEERNSPFVFVYIRRLIVLYLIGVIHEILTRHDILHNYAMAGVLLLVLHKLPRKLLPVLALLCFLVPWTRQMIKELKRETLTTKTVSVDTIILDRYVGVFENPQKRRLIFLRNRDTLIGEGLGQRFILTPISDSHFVRKDFNHIFTFKKDSANSLNILNIELPNGTTIIEKRIDADLQEALREQLKQRAAATQGSANQSYKKFVTGNAQAFWNQLKNWSWKNYFWGNAISGILPLFLMGLYFGRRKVFYDISLNRSFLRNVLKWGLLVGMTSFAIALGFQAWNYFNGIYDESYSFLTRHIMYACGDFLGRMGMALGYVAGMALLLANIDWKKKLSFLAPIGRMGLTNYLLQSAIISIVIENFALGLNGKAGPAWRLLMAAATFVFIALLSRWWFKHFKIGPIEWLWRSLTYLKFQPMRLNQPNAS